MRSPYEVAVRRGAYLARIEHIMFSSIYPEQQVHEVGEILMEWREWERRTRPSAALGGPP
jgi:hypothetical protein